MIGKKIGSAFVLMALFLVTAVPAASAHGSQQGEHNGFRVEMVPVDRFYGDFDSGLLLFAGLTPEDFCNDATPPMAPARVFERQDGTITVTVPGIRGIDLFLFEFDGGAFELIDVTCAAMFDQDPTTQPLQPFAVGKGRVKITLAGLEGLDDTGGFHVRNSATGSVTAEDGSRWRVRGHASFDVDEDGFPIGDPADFQGLLVRQTRRSS